MYEKAFELQIITPTSVALKSAAVSIRAPGTNGSFQVLYNHAPLLSTLEPGEIVVTQEGGNQVRYATGGGFLEVKSNQVVVLADSVETADQIDTARAELAKERAEARLKSKDPGIDTERARVALLRAVNRLRVAGRG